MSTGCLLDEATGKHHKVDSHLYLHYKGTCNICEVPRRCTARQPFVPLLLERVQQEREQQEGKQQEGEQRDKVRLAPSNGLGWVAIVYEEKGRMTFSVQLDSHRTAWQRIEWKWKPGFNGENWDADEVQKAVDNFVDVAKREYELQKSKL